MKKKWMGFLLATLFACSAGADQTKCVHFIVKVPSMTPPGSRIFLTGNVRELGKWKPDARELYAIGPSLYQVDVTLPASTESVSFKFTRGSYPTEEADEGGNIPANAQLRLWEETTTVVRGIAHWADQAPLASRPTVKAIENFYSPQLRNHRTLLVYLPPSYARSPQRRYPVMYIHDGQSAFGPEYGWGALGMDRVSEALAGRGEMPETILVGIGSTTNRDDEYDYDVAGQRYMRFVLDTLKPFIDARYRTHPSRERTGTLGVSLGASIAMNLLWLHPEVFSFAAGLSLPVFNQNSALLRMVEDGPTPPFPVRLYFDHGDYGQDSGYAGSVGRFYEALLKQGIDRSAIEYLRFPYGDHCSLDWARRIDLPLKFMSKE